MKIGIDLGGSHIAIGVVNNDGEIIEKVEKRILEKEKRNINGFLECYITENVMEFMGKYKITSVGLAIPGILTKTTIVKSVNLGIKDYNIVDKLKDKLNLPIKIENDAKCAALAEDRYGVLKKYNKTVFFTLGTGIGGATIIDGKLLSTGNNSGCEFGHMVIEKNGIECKCGRKGCWEKYASMNALKSNITKVLNLDEATRGEEILDIIRSNNESNKDYEKIEKVVSDFIEDLSIGIANLVNIFEPEAIGIGGSFVYFEDVFLDRLKENIKTKNMLFNPRDNLIIETAVLGNDAGMIGASLI